MNFHKKWVESSGTVINQMIVIFYIYLHFDCGLSAGRNIMVDFARTDYCSLLDDDTLILPFIDKNNLGTALHKLLNFRRSPNRFNWWIW